MGEHKAPEAQELPVAPGAPADGSGFESPGGTVDDGGEGHDHVGPKSASTSYFPNAERTSGRRSPYSNILDRAVGQQCRTSRPG